MDLPEGITFNNGIYYNLHGMDVTLIAKVIADTLRKYDNSVEFLKKYDENFVINHSRVVNAVETIAPIAGENVQEYIVSLVEEIREYGFSIGSSDKPDLVQFMLLQEVKRILDTLVALDAIFSTLRFDYNVQLH